jgi:hypothetical protein
MDDLRCSSAGVSFVIGSDDCYQSVLYKHIAMIHGIDVLQTRYLGTSRRLSCGKMHEKQKALQKSIDLSTIKLNFSEILHDISPAVKGTETIPQPICTNHPA